MKPFRLRVHHFNAAQAAVLLIILGVGFGVIFANLFQNSYQEQMEQYKDTVFTDIMTNKINYNGLFTYILGKNFKEFFIFWLLCITVLGTPYIAFKLISFGFYSGFFISAVTMQYGFKGILLVLAYEFPHGLIYLPVVLICLYKGFSLCKSVYEEKRYSLSGILRLLKPQMIVILVLCIALLIGSFLEAYVGAFLLKKTLRLFC